VNSAKIAFCSKHSISISVTIYAGTPDEINGNKELCKQTPSIK
jgi:hypothetical protein